MIIKKNYTMFFLSYLFKNKKMFLLFYKIYETKYLDPTIAVES